MYILPVGGYIRKKAVAGFLGTGCVGDLRRRALPYKRPSITRRAALQHKAAARRARASTENYIAFGYKGHWAEKHHFLPQFAAGRRVQVHTSALGKETVAQAVVRSIVNESMSRGMSPPKHDAS